MALLLLLRHGVTAMTGKRLYGRSSGVGLSEAGREQAARLAERVRAVRPRAVYSSPLERCRETAGAVADACGVEVRVLPEVNEIDYGDLTGRTFAAVRRSSVWRRLQERPSATRFPGGESLVEAQRRSVEALERLAERHRRSATAVVTHGDVIRLAVAHFAGVHIDLYRRIEVVPGSASVLSLGDGEPRVLRLNDTGTIDDLVAGRSRRTVRG